MSVLEIFLRILGYLLLLWLPGKRCELKQFMFRLQYCSSGNAVKDIDLNFDPNDWLKANPDIAVGVIWLKFGRVLQPWANWSRAQRRDLSVAYFNARIDALQDIPDAPVDAAPQTVGISASTFYPEPLAWRIYVAHVATLIAGEQAGWLQWRMQSLPPAQRAALLDARHYFDQWSNGERYVSGLQSGPITLSDPTKVLRNLRQLNLIQATRRQTVAALVEWCRQNMLHYGVTPGLPDDSGDVNAQHWQYRGDPPQIRILEGTTHDSGDFSHWTAGCHGTAAFLKATLRLLGVPVFDIHPCREHATVQFPTEGWYLGHGDDPYSRLSRFDPPRPTEELFMDESEFAAWLGPALTPAARCANVGRHVVARALANPTSTDLLQTYCRDLAASRSHANGEVIGIFSPFYSLAELEASGLWQRLDAAVAARGGCANI